MSSPSSGQAILMPCCCGKKSVQIVPSISTPCGNGSNHETSCAVGNREGALKSCRKVVAKNNNNQGKKKVFVKELSKSVIDIPEHILGDDGRHPVLQLPESELTTFPVPHIRVSSPPLTPRHTNLHSAHFKRRASLPSISADSVNIIHEEGEGLDRPDSLSSSMSSIASNHEKSLDGGEEEQKIGNSSTYSRVSQEEVSSGVGITDNSDRSADLAATQSNKRFDFDTFTCDDFSHEFLDTISSDPTYLLSQRELDKLVLQQHSAPPNEKCRKTKKSIYKVNQLNLCVITWNMNGNVPPRNLSNLFFHHSNGNPDTPTPPPFDMYVINTQETYNDKFEWEVRIQSTLGPCYVLFHSTSMGMLHQAIFIRKTLIWSISFPESDAFNSHPGTQVIRTKGAIATAFILFGTSFLFVNCHLTAHEANSKDRLNDLRRINSTLNIPRKLPIRSSVKKSLFMSNGNGATGGLDLSDKCDVTFWAGDLNFRLEQSRELIIRDVEDNRSVLEFDQLNYLRKHGLIFKNYQESEIRFVPTYKYDVGTSLFDSSNKQRTPSYTDRILYKHANKTSARFSHHKNHATPPQVHPLQYDSVQEITTSDHKPVWGAWQVTLTHGHGHLKLIECLSSGLFNRPVFAEGMRRRLNEFKLLHLQPDVENVLNSILNHNNGKLKQETSNGESRDGKSGSSSTTQNHMLGVSSGLSRTRALSLTRYIVDLGTNIDSFTSSTSNKDTDLMHVPRSDVCRAKSFDFSQRVSSSLEDKREWNSCRRTVSNFNVSKSSRKRSCKVQ